MKSFRTLNNRARSLADPTAARARKSPKKRTNVCAVASSTHGIMVVGFGKPFS